MKGNEKVIQKLNELLADELTATNQYILHSEMCKNWEYDKLHDKIEERAIAEMRHAEKLISRVLFLEGKPIVSILNPIHVGGDVQEQFRNDLEAEKMAVQAYNEGIRLAVDLGDNGTRALLETILNDEENHLDWLEAQLDQILQMGYQNYLTEQVS